MLLSKKHNFIFIHIYKTAGSSITRALLPYCIHPFHYYAHLFLKKFRVNILDPFPHRTHIKASELIQDMGYKHFKSYFSFAVVRNPWDWNVSLYKFMLKNTLHHEHEKTKKFKSFDQFIKARCKGNLPFQADFILSNEGQQLVDIVARFETIENDFKKICSRIGIEAELPHRNVSNTTPYREFYTDETKELVYKSYQKDIEYFEYEY